MSDNGTEEDQFDWLAGIVVPEDQDADYLAADEVEETEEPKKRKGVLFPILMILAILCFLLGVGLFGYQTFITPEGQYRDMDNNLVVPEDVLTPEEIEEIEAVPEVPGKRFRVPAVGLDAPLGAMNKVGDTINPPGFYSVFWIRNMGVSVENAAKGTVYLVAHSLRHGGKGPGNYLIDVENSRGNVPVGAEMYVDKTKYLVTEVISVPKTDVGSVEGIWDEKKPGQVVVITCLQRTDNGKSRNNIVVVGQLAKDQSPP